MIAAHAATSANALELLGITKRFGSVVALDDVDFRVGIGSVHALLGENGAGKTTLMRIAYGVASADSGSVERFGRRTTYPRAGADGPHAGFGMVEQQLSLVPNLSALENFALGRRGLFRRGTLAREFRSVVDASGLHVPPDMRVADLSIVEQQRLEILKAVGREARLLILDEPTTGLAPPEVDSLLTWIRGFAARGGTVVVVTHKLREALAVADAVTVLRQGRIVHVTDARSATADGLARAIFPDAPPPAPARTRAGPGERVAEVEAVSVVDARGVERLRNATVRLHRGEVVGVAAVEGSGHRELLAALAGLTPVVRGARRVPDRVGVIPAHRQRDALIPDFTLVENVALHRAERLRGRVRWSSFRARTREMLARFEIVASSEDAAARTLSGGNQQRLVVARELADAMDLIVAEEPTRGLDLRASAFVHAALQEAASRGAAVVVYSSDLDELLPIVSRVIVVFNGEVHEVPTDRDVIGRAMIGAI